MQNNSKTLWDAVKTEPNFQRKCFMIKSKLILLIYQVCLTLFFLNKVASITNNLNINPNVHNGTRKVNAENQFFMSSTEILDVISSIKNKK